MSRPKASAVFGLAAVVFLAMAMNVMLLIGRNAGVIVVVLFVLGLAAALIWGGLRLFAWTDAPSGRRSARRFNAVLASVVFFGICAAVYALVGQVRASWDLTQEGRRQLAPITRQVLETLDQDVEVYGLFITAADSAATAARENTRRFLNMCEAHTPHLDVRFADPQKDTLLVNRLELTGLSSEGTVVVKSGARQREVNLTDVPPRLQERDFVNALIHVAHEESPKIYFLTGHGETSFDDPDPNKGATQLKGFLEEEGYRLDTLSLTPVQPDVPADCDVLFINGQRSDLRADDIAALDAYMDRGGRILLLFDFWTVQEGYRDEQLRPWLLREAGIDVGVDLLMSLETGPEVYLVPSFAAVGLDGGDQRGSYNDSHIITRGIGYNMVFTGVRSVTLDKPLPDEVATERLLWTPPNYWAETNLDLLLHSSDPVARPDEGEMEGPLPLAAAATRQTEVPIGDTGRFREARMVVVGNRDFAANRSIAQPGHADLILNMFAWLSERPELIAIRPSVSKQQAIVLTPPQEKAIVWVSTLGVVHAVVIAGIIAWWTRRRHQ